MKISKDELQNVLEELEGFKGRQTELISVYIASGYDTISVQKQLEAEKSTAKNIKSTSTRKNVGEALDKIVRHLKDYKRTPDNGIAVFCGNVSQVEGQTDLRLWAIEPPEPLKVRLYRCDKEFVLEHLQEQLVAGEVYGLILMDRKEATIGILEGKRIETIQKLTSGVPSKVRAGGQSSQRFHRITEGLTKEFYKRIADEAKLAFFDNPRLKGILIGGPIPTKDEFIDGQYLLRPLHDKILGRVDMGETSEAGLPELVNRSQEILASQEIIKERNLLEKFFEKLGRNPDFAKYKKEDIEKALEFGAVETILISKNADRQLAKELKTKAEAIGSKIEVVSMETDEGKQFMNITQDGIGALLRFKV